MKSTLIGTTHEIYTYRHNTWNLHLYVQHMKSTLIYTAHEIYTYMHKTWNLHICTAHEIFTYMHNTWNLHLYAWNTWNLHLQAWHMKSYWHKWALRMQESFTTTLRAKFTTTSLKCLQIIHVRVYSQRHTWTACMEIRQVYSYRSLKWFDSPTLVFLEATNARMIAVSLFI